jgi:hypothetical protein
VLLLLRLLAFRRLRRLSLALIAFNLVRRYLRRHGS